MESWLTQLLFKFSYVALVALLAAAGLGAPISEDLVLLISGALAARGVTDFWPTVVLGYLGVLLGDVLIHHWGVRMGQRAYSSKLVQRALSPERQEKLREHFACHGMLTVVVGRHTPGLRAPIFFLAGASGVPLWKFLIADALSAVVTVPFVTTLGYKFAEHLPEIRARLHHLQWLAGGAVAVAVLIWLGVRHLRARARSSR